MGGLSDYLENELLDHVFPTSSAWTRPTNLFCALFNDDANDDGSGTEVSGGNYARVTADSWDAATNGAIANGADITFATATGGWNTVVSWGIFDTSTGGNLLAWGSLTTNQVIGGNDVANFSAGALDITCD